MRDVELSIDLIINEYSNYVFKIVDNITNTSLSYQDKEEIVSDTFYLLWKNQKRVTSNLKSYLGVIARNCAYDKLRRNKINFQYSDQLIYDNSINDSMLIVKEKLKKLSKNERDIFNLYYVNGYKVKEISKILDEKQTTIKVKLHRIRKKLREEFNYEN